MVKRFGYFTLVIAALVGVASSPAKADQLVDFSCGSGSCTGTVVPSGANFSSTGIGVTPGTTISEVAGDTFSLIFDTSSGSIQVLENEGSGFVLDFGGTITNFTSSSLSGLTDLNLSVNWTTIPGDVSGTTGTTPFSSVISIVSNGSAYSVDVPISTTTVPEPSSILLLGAGLLLTPLLGIKRPC